MKFSTKLTILLLGIVVVMTAVIFYVVRTTGTKILEEHIKESLGIMARHTMEEIDRVFYERYVDIRMMASSPAINSEENTVKQITERLTEYRDISKGYDSISFFDLNRVRIVDTEGLEIGKQHPLAGYWKDIDAGKDFTMDLGKSVSLGKHIFHFAHVVKSKEGKKIGVVVSRVPVENIHEIIKGIAGFYKKGKEAEIDLVDRTGLLIYSNYNMDGILRDNLGEWEGLKKFQTGHTETVRHDCPLKEGEPTICIFTPEQGYKDFKGNGWTLILHIPTKYAFAPIAKLTKQLFIVILLLTCWVVLTVLFFSHAVSRSLMKLKDAALEIGKGNLDVKVKAGSNDEIGQLAAAFGGMAADLKKSRQEIEEYSKTLELRVAERTEELRASNEELESINEELKQSNEELAAADKELRATMVELREAKAELEKKYADREEFHKLVMGREKRVLELKEEIERLKEELAKHKKD